MTEKKQCSEQTRLALGSASREAEGIYKPFAPGPNTKLPDFIKQHATPYDPKTDKYDVKAFDQDLIVDKSAPPKAIYDMHTYWSKKHWAAIRQYIGHYLPKKYYPDGAGMVLDCFSGSGMTGVAAMMENRSAVLVDASPAAAFISHCYTDPVDPNELQAANDQMMSEEYPADLKKQLKKSAGKDIQNLRQELNWLSGTKCDRCCGEAIIDYVVYSERFQCPRCGEVVALFDCPEVKVPYLAGGKAKQRTEVKQRRVCPHCLKKHGAPHRDFVISTRTKRFGAVPVLVNYTCVSGCKVPNDSRRHDEPRNTRKAKFFEQCDLSLLRTIERSEVPHWYPHRKMMDVQDDSKPWGDNWRPGRNFRSIAELYTKRNLWAMAALVSACSKVPAGDAFRLAVIGLALGASRMNMYVPDNWSMQNRIKKGSYYLPQISTAVNILPQFRNKLKVIIKAQRELVEAKIGEVCLTNDTALRFKAPDQSFDYIFTDPSYVGKVQYGELNFVWEAWLGVGGEWLKDEIIVNEVRGKSVQDWEGDLRSAVNRCHTLLKPGRWLSLCYHDTDADTWSRLQNVLLDAGFEIHTVTVLDPIPELLT
jgi:DNA modification methylase